MEIKKNFGFWTKSLMVGLVLGAVSINYLSQPNVLISQTKNSQTNLSQNPAVQRLQDFSEGFAIISEAVTPSIVTIFSEKTEKIPSMNFGNPFFWGNPNQAPEQERKSRGLGSGIIVKSDGTILTNNHVVENSDDLKVKLSDGRTLKAEVIGTDPKTDVAVIKINAGNDLPALILGDSDKIRVGEWVLAIGNPFSEDLSSTVTQGIISGTGRSEVGITQYDNLIQTDAAVNPGNSGGALVNLKGELIGINTAILSRTGSFAGISFAIPVNQAKDVMEDLLTKGKVVRGWLGVTIQNITPELAKAMDLKSEKGAIVSDVLSGGPSEKAGLISGDVVTELNGHEVVNTTTFRNKIASINPDETVKLKVIRDGKEKTLNVKLGELPDDVREWQKTKGSQTKDEFLGIEVKPFSEDFAKRYRLDKDEKGVVVTNIDPKSKAFSAGIREGDLIQKIGKTQINSISDFQKATKEIDKNSPTAFFIKREGGSLFLAVTLG
ncbi:DegQ family serine endoprotease [bacterium]|nr:DegQ family serine endoprotease [bacterium]